MRIPFIFILLLSILIPTSSFGWIPETVELYGEKQLEPSLRPDDEIKNIDNERRPTSTTAGAKSQNVPEPEKKESNRFEFQMEHMKYRLENQL